MRVEHTGVDEYRRPTFIDPPPHEQPGARREPPPVTGEPRIHALVEARRTELQGITQLRERELQGANDALATARELRRIDTKEVRQGIADATAAVTFATADRDLAQHDARAWEDLIAGSAGELARLAILDSEQSDPAIVIASKPILAQAKEGVALFVGAVVASKKLAADTARARGTASDIAKRLCIKWAPNRGGEFAHARAQLRDVLYAGWRAAGYEISDLLHLVK